MQTQLIYRWYRICRCIRICQHDSQGKEEREEGRGRPQTRSARLSLAYSLSHYSSQTESKERALSLVWNISNRIKRASASVKERQQERRGTHASRWQPKRVTTHRAAKMQRLPYDLPSGGPRSALHPLRRTQYISRDKPSARGRGRV